jgi:hypothetical protein
MDQMASSGATAWTKYFQGKGTLETIVKKDSPVYDAQDPNKKLNITLKAGTVVVYQSVKLYESKALVSLKTSAVNNQVRIPFDNLAKPGVKASGAASLKPQAFGIQEKKYSIADYKKNILDSIESRQDLNPALKTYLSLLVDYHSGGTTTTSQISKLFAASKQSIPINDVNKDFGEVIGPLACIKKQLFKTKKILFSTAAQVWMPLRPNEPLMDYSIIDKDKSYIISAKSGETTNTVKPKDILMLIDKNEISKKKWKDTKEYKILKVLDEETALVGPIKAVAILNPDLIKIEDIKITSKTEFNKQTFDKFSKENVYLKTKVSPTLNEIMYECEKMLQKESKEGSLNYNTIFSDAIQNQVMYVKFELDATGVGSWQIITSDDIKSSNEKHTRLSFRTKNGYTRAGDKLGIQV